MQLTYTFRNPSRAPSSATGEYAQDGVGGYRHDHARQPHHPPWPGAKEATSSRSVEAEIWLSSGRLSAGTLISVVIGERRAPDPRTEPPWMSGRSLRLDAVRPQRQVIVALRRGEKPHPGSSL